LEDAVYDTHYVQIEGVWHETAEDETTVCGLAIPYPGTPWTREVPDKVHCGENATAEKPAPAKKPAAKAKKK
jgi:hypothetical protein